MVKFDLKIRPVCKSLQIKAFILLCALPFFAHTGNNYMLFQEPKKNSEARTQVKRQGSMEPPRPGETERQRAKRQKKSVTFKYHKEKKPKASKHKILPKS